MKDSTTCYCSCYAGLFDCTTCQESKKLRGTGDNLAGHFGNLFVHLTPDPTWSFEHHSRFFAGIFLFIYNISDGSIPKSLILAFYSLAVSSQINNAFSASQGFCHHRVRKNLICNYAKSFLQSSLECARMSEGIFWLFFQPRSCDNKISLQCKNDIKRSLSRINVNIL